MEKTLKEEEVKDLEKEIDTAVDRLFVEKKRGAVENSWSESSFSTPFYEGEKKFDRERTAPHIPQYPSLLKSIEKMETQLLSLEWEITKENIEKTRREVLSLRDLFREKPNIFSLLNLMEEVLNDMIKKEENIHPSYNQFLLDSKETIKLLMEKETDDKIKMYKKLAHSGIEARFSYLGVVRSPEGKAPVLSLSEEKRVEEGVVPERNKMEEIVNKMNIFSGKMDEILKKIDQHLFAHEQWTKKPGERFVEAKPATVNVTIFRVNERLFGIESDKIFKIFKVPSATYEKFLTQTKIRLKDLELRMIDLKKIFSIQGEDRKEDKQILTVKGDGEYRGLMIDQILSKLMTSLGSGPGGGEHFIGMIHWTYQNQPVEIPVLDVKKF
jgi:hypothetical protein